MPVSSLSNCKYHPEREGIGICVRCRTVICSECSTKIDGINNCHYCLEQLKKENDPIEGFGTLSPSRSVLSLLLYGAFTSFLIYWILRTLLIPY